MEERRRAIRRKGRWTLLIRGSASTEVDVLDLSATGLKFRSQEPVQIGMMVELQMKVNEVTLLAQARIVRQEPPAEEFSGYYIHGVEFLYMSQEDRHRLSDVLMAMRRAEWES